MPNDLITYWAARVLADITPFRDPGTEIHEVTSGRQIHVSWQAQGRPLEADVTIKSNTGEARVQFGGRTLDYMTFLAGPELADLMGLAKAILQTSKRGVYVDTQGVRPDAGPGASPQSAVELLRSLLNAESHEATRVITVIGDAGAGKTFALRELVRRGADAYVRGQTSLLPLYVNAQGRSLAKLSEAFAVELQDLRCQLPYHGIAALCRVGALVPVIDGFDELLGVTGYEGAFSSLAGFVEELDGFGQLIASARSSYYEEEFVARASGVSSLGAQSWIQVPVRVRDWRDEDVRDYVEQRAAERAFDAEMSADLERRVDVTFSDRFSALKTKPFFVAKAVDLLLAQEELPDGDDLLDRLVAGFVQREAGEKLRKEGGPALTEPQVHDLLENLAEEMWHQGLRELNKRSVREVAEYCVALAELEDTVQRMVIERMPSMCFLTSGERPGSIAFEHEVFFAHFLGIVLSRRLLNPEHDVRPLLGRAPLPESASHACVRALLARKTTLTPAIVQSLLDRLGSSRADFAGIADQVRENAGRMAQEILATASGGQHGPLLNLRIEHMVFPGGDLDGVWIRSGTLCDLDFRRTSLRTTRLEACSACDVLFREVVVDPQSTVLDLAGMDPRLHVLGLQVQTDAGVERVYDPHAIAQILAACGLAISAVPPATRAIPDRILKLLDRLVRAYLKANPLCMADSNLMRHVFQDPDWPRLEKLLLQSGVLTKETRPTGGQSKWFLRRQFLPEQIMAGVRPDAGNAPAAVMGFWDALEAEYSPRG
jgi:hypothetical protein